jgi:filamentous haemagglutinin family N-terminal domain
LPWQLVVAGLVLPFSTIMRAEVTLDGTLGPAGPLTGPDYAIPAEVGRQIGSNLFHSFGLFNVNTGESATFTGPPVIDNILSRVTGGSPSFIDGLLRSAIESANLWFINPSGVLFGPNASLDVDGSFHVSTADYLKLEEGGRFGAAHPENSVLTTAPPEAFGFLGENPAGISVQGSFLQVPDGETLSVVGGDIKVADGSLYAPAGRINMASMASPGEVIPNESALGVASFERLGRIELLHSSSERPQVGDQTIGNVDVSGEGGGRIFIRSGEFVAENAFIFADTRGSEEGQGIDMGVTGHVTVRNGALITVDTLGSGSGGDLAVEAGSLEVQGGAQVDVSTFDSGDGGQLSVEAGSILLTGTDASGFPSGLFASTQPGSSGDAGDLTVNAGNLLVRDGGIISGRTFGPGFGGNLFVNAANIDLREGAASLLKAKEPAAPAISSSARVTPSACSTIAVSA